jgi:alpha-glucosidase
MQRDERGVHFECGDSYLAITVLAPNLIRAYDTSGEMMPRRSWAVTLDDAEWPIVSFEVREKQEAVEIETEQMCASIANPVALYASTKLVVRLPRM